VPDEQLGGRGRLAVRHNAPRAAQRRARHRDGDELTAVEVAPDRLPRREGGPEPGHGAGDHGAAGAEGQPGRVGVEPGEHRLAVRARGRARLPLQPPGGGEVEALRRRGRGDHHEQVGADRPDNGVRDAGRRPAADHHVGLVRGEHRPDPFAAADLEAQVHPGVRAEKRAELARQQVLPRGRHRRHPDPAMLRVAAGASGGQRLRVQAEDLPRVAGVGLPWLGQPQPSARPLDKRHPDFAGQRGERGRHRGLGDGQTARRGPYRAGVRDGHQGAQPGHCGHALPPWNN
jgi:hypothetical protein